MTSTTAQDPIRPEPTNSEPALSSTDRTPETNQKARVVVRTFAKTIIVVLLTVAGLAAGIFALLGTGAIVIPALGSSPPAGTAESEHVAALTATIEQMRYLLGGLGLLLTIVISIQAYVQFRQDDGATQVSGILGVVRDTLITRLDAEKDARQEAKDLRRESRSLEAKIADIESGLGGLQRLRASIDVIVRTQREEIETAAESLAQTPRHGFRVAAVAERLTSFANQYDTFTSQFIKLEEQPQEFSGRALYVRGIAAHHANNADAAQSLLSKVTGLPRPAYEPEDTYQRRVANAFYYLGVANSNFGDVTQATANFREAIRRDLDGRDYLTRVVNAETLVMAGRTDDAKREAQEIVTLVDEQAQGPGLVTIHRRLRSRAILVQANAAIVIGHDTYASEVNDLLRPVLADDPEYYYAVATLAQVTAVSGGSDSGSLFRDAFAAILRHNEVHTVTEVRSRILLHLTAAICLRANAQLRRCDEYLDRANELRAELPTLRGRSCTVFSPLSKLNESSEMIQVQIGQIREGQLLVPGRLAMSPP